MESTPAFTLSEKEKRAQGEGRGSERRKHGRTEGEHTDNHKRDTTTYSTTLYGIYQDFVKNILYFANISCFSASICLLALFCTFFYRYRQIILPRRCQ